jgi:hypothetical protein
MAGESPLLSIDPALVGTPSNSSPGNENEFEGHDDEDEGGEASGNEEADTVPEMITPIEVGGKGEAQSFQVVTLRNLLLGRRTGNPLHHWELVVARREIR